MSGGVASAIRPVHYFLPYRCVWLVLYLVFSIEPRDHPEHQDFKISGKAKAMGAVIKKPCGEEFERS